MSNPNTPGNGSEAREKGTENKSGKTIESLIKKVTSEKNGGFDPYILNQLQFGSTSRQKILKEIRESMHAGFDEEEYGFDKNTINTISDGELRGYLEKYSRDLQSLRKNTDKRIKRYFPDAEYDVRTLNDDIQGYSENELTSILENSTSIKKYLREKLGIRAEKLTFWKPKLREIFEPENITEEDFKNRLEKAIERFENSNVPLDQEIIREIIGYYGNKSEKIEKIAKEFHVTFSIQEAIRMGMISTASVDQFTEREYQDIWNSLSAEQQVQLKVATRKDDSLELSLDELRAIDRSHSQSYDVKKIKDALASNIHNGFREFTNDTHRPNLTTSFAEFVEKLNAGTTKINIYPVDKLGEGSVMVCRERGGKIRFLKIEKVDEGLSIQNGVAGLTLSFLDGIEEGTIGQAKGKSTISYESLEEKLAQMEDIQVMSESDLRAQINAEMFQDEHGQVIRDASKEEDEYSFEYLKNKLDTIDSAGKNIEIKTGMIFSAKVEVTDGKGKNKKDTVTFTVLSVNQADKTITISNTRDTQVITFHDFVKIAEDGTDFRRVAVMNSDHDFTHAISDFVEDFENDIHIKDGKFIPSHDDHNEGSQHGHDDHGHAKNPTIEYFRTGDGDGHIRLFEIGGAFVSFGEYDPPSGIDLEKIRQANGAKKLSKKQEKGMYKLRTMTRAQFLTYLKDNKFKATTDDLFDPHAGYHPHDPHMHGGGFMGLFKGPSINDIFKGFSNITHGIEHYFEKNSKLNASRFALRVGRTFNLPLDIMAQLQADEVSSMKEIIEKIQDKLFNLNGPVARNKALHIAQLTSSSAEEVGAAMIYMVKSYGHLYAEDIAHATGSESFLNGFLYSLGWRSKSEIDAMKREAHSKFMADLGSGSDGGKPTEEEIIWGLLKIIDGRAGLDKSNPKYDPRYANAGAVVKAMGGPSGWEKAWRTEGIKNAFDKGIRQGGAVVNAAGRVNKGLSALKTFELNTAMGFLEKAAGKSPDPSIQTIPVVWALGGYSKYCSTEMKQSIKGYGDSRGHTFHAYAFLRNEEDNETYTKVFIKALESIDLDAARKAKEAIDIIHLGPRNDNKKTKDAYEKAIDTLADIWKNYQGNGLHDHLQGKSTWIMKKINEGDTTVKKYAKRFAAIHLMNSGERQVPNDNDWNVQYGINTSGMFGDNKGNATKEQDGKQVLSIAATLNKLPISGYELDKDAYDRLWPLILGHFQRLEGESDESLQKAQYKQFREDVIKHFRNRMSIRAGGITAAVDEVVRKDYFQGLARMGIQPEELFVSTPIHIGADAGYTRWRSGGGSTYIRGTERVQDWVERRTAENMRRGQAI